VNDTARSVQRLERMLAVTRELTSTVSLEPLLMKIVDTAAELTESEGASILLWDVRTGELRFRAAAGDPQGRLSDIPVPITGSIAGAVFETGEPLIIADAREDPRHYSEVGQRIGFETRSLLAVPMEISERRIGVLEAVNKRSDERFTEEDVETLTVLAAQAAVAVENARLVGALQEAYAQLGELDRLKSDFIAIASHELRTPLSLILGYASLLHGQLGDQARAELDMVLRAALRLKQLIETMLNLRYLETGEAELSCSCFDLRRSVEEACETYRSLAEAKGLTLTADLPAEPLVVCADPDKLPVILDNLLSNAVKFTPPGGQVWVTACTRGDQVELVVADNGPGIPQKDLQRIFDRFVQVENHMTRRHGGMGLGLSIVKGLVEQHGGRVWAESTLGQGSRFVCLLPTRP